jgi:Transcriptional activator, adenine-specific DNA methyltransferase
MAEVVRKESPELWDKAKAGDITINKAYTTHRQVKRRAEVKQQIESVEAQEVKALAGVYDVIIVDPPWPMEKIERDVAPEQVAFEYPTMSLDEIHGMEIPSADDCHVWLWTTHKYLPEAFDVLQTWGMKYVCAFVWHKPGGFQPFNLPQYNCEFALYARRGTPPFLDLRTSLPASMRPAESTVKSQTSFMTWCGALLEGGDWTCSIVAVSRALMDGERRLSNGNAELGNRKAMV